MIIRTFKSLDLEAILQVFYEAVHTTGAKYYDQEQVNTWAPKDGLDKDSWLKSLSDNITYVVELDGKIAAIPARKSLADQA